MSTHESTPPAGAPVPEVQAADVEPLTGLELPALTLESTGGPLDLQFWTSTRSIIFFFPRPEYANHTPSLAWQQVPNAVGSLPQAKTFSDRAQEMINLGARVCGISSAPLAELEVFAKKHGILYPLVSDPEFKLRDALKLPTFEFVGNPDAFVPEPEPEPEPGAMPTVIVTEIGPDGRPIRIVGQEEEVVEEVVDDLEEESTEEPGATPDASLPVDADDEGESVSESEDDIEETGELVVPAEPIEYYHRLTFVAEAGKVEKVIFPSYPMRDAHEISIWLQTPREITPFVADNPWV
jgi:peroxiredoxin